RPNGEPMTATMRRRTRRTLLGCLPELSELPPSSPRWMGGTCGMYGRTRIVPANNNERGATVADADTVTPMTYSNLFLTALPPKELRLLQPGLRLVDFSRGTVLNEPGQLINDVLFIESGMVSLLTEMSDGAAIENGTLGRESILGALGALGSHRASTRAVVQIPTTGWRMQANEFRAATDKSK